MRGPETVLMLDARNVYRKVTRKIYDFSPEQMQNLSAIVWLYRGQRQRFLELVKDYLGHICAESAAIPGALAPFEITLADLRGRFGNLPLSPRRERAGVRGLPVTENETEPTNKNRHQALADAVTEPREAAALYEPDAKKLRAALETFRKRYDIEGSSRCIHGSTVRQAHGSPRTGKSLTNQPFTVRPEPVVGGGDWGAEVGGSGSC